MITRIRRWWAVALPLMYAPWVNAAVLAGESAIKPGDRIIALYDTPVRAGAETAATVSAGIDLVASGTDGDWVGVSLQDRGRQVSGWIASRDLAPLGSGPGTASAYFKRGMQRFRQGDFRTAIRELSEAIRINPQLGAAFLHRGRAKLALSRFDRGPASLATSALDDLNEAVRLDPKAAFAHLCRGVYDEVHGDLGQAIAHYTEAVRVDAQYAQALSNRGTLYARTGQHEKALADLSQAVRIDPRHVRSYRERASVHRRLGQHEKAVADLTEAIRVLQEGLAGAKAGGSRDAPRLLCRFDDSAECAQVYYDRGEARRTLGDTPSAIADYSEAIRLSQEVLAGLSPADRTALDAATAAAVAKVLLDRSHSRKTLLALTYCQRGMCQASRGNHDQALADLREALRVEPGMVYAWDLSGQVLTGMGRITDALAHHDEAIRLTPEEASLYLQRARCRLAVYLATDPLARLGLISTIAIQDPKFAKLTDKEREVLRDQAIADLSEAIRLRAAFADAYTLRAAHTPDQDQAISDLTKLIALSPETADLYVKRESLCAKKGDYQKAAGDFTEAIKRGSDTAALRRQRAEAYVKTRDFAGALADYRKLGEKMSLNCAAEAISLRAEPAEGKVTATASRPPGLIVEDVRGEWLYVRPMFNESKGWVHQKEVR